MSQIDNQPLRYWNGNAIYLTMFLTLGLAVGTIVTLMLDAGSATGAQWLVYSPGAFLHGAVWQPFTYLFVNPLNFFTPLALICFYSWGVEVEKYLGRAVFISLIGMLVLVPVILGLVLYPFGGGTGAAGVGNLVACLLVAFATLYPNMDYLGGWIPLKWFAFVCIACQSITYFPHQNWGGLFSFWLMCATAFYMVRNARGLWDWQFQWPQWLKRKPRFRVVPHPSERNEPSASSSAPRRVRASQINATVAQSAAEAEVDALLDKIARSGLASLSAAERDRLEKARQEMLKKGS